MSSRLRVPRDDEWLREAQHLSATTIAPPTEAGAIAVAPNTALTPAHVIALQRSAGNSAVARLIKADDPSAGVEDRGVSAKEATDGLEYEHPAAEHGEQALPTSGTIDTLEDDDPESTHGCDRAGTAPAPPPPERAVAVRSHLTVEARTGEGRVPETRHHRSDSIKPRLSVGSAQTEDSSAVAAGDFGGEDAAYKMDQIKWKHDAAGGTVDVSARVFLDIKWGVNSNGRTSVAGPNDPAVTKGTWKDIVKDIGPDPTGRLQRDTFWCDDLTRKHEKFHAQDDIGQAQKFLPTANTWLAAAYVDANNVEDDVKGRLESVRIQVKQDGTAHYRSGGEDRAYADGKSSYQARASAVQARAKKEGW